MIKKSLKFWLFGLLVSLWLMPAGLYAASPFIFSVWIPYWYKTAATAETAAHLNQLKEISPFAYYVNADGTLSDKMKITAEPWTKLLTDARGRGVKVIPTVIWTDGSAIHKILTKKVSRDRHIKQIMATVSSGNFDGVDIDYENKKATTRTYFSAFIRDLAAALHAQKKVLSCTVEARTPAYSTVAGTADPFAYANDYPALNKYCDQVRLMTYDQTTGDFLLNKSNVQKGPYSPVADMAWVRKVAFNAQNDIKPSKIMIGVASYGYEFEVLDKVKYYDYKRLRSLSYQDFVVLAKKVNATPVRNSAGELSFLYTADDKTTRLAEMSDAGAIAAKIKFAKTFGFRGVALFRVDGVSDNFWPAFVQ